MAPYNAELTRQMAEAMSYRVFFANRIWWNQDNKVLCSEVIDPEDFYA